MNPKIISKNNKNVKESQMMRGKKETFTNFDRTLIDIGRFFSRLSLLHHDDPAQDLNPCAPTL